MFNNHMSRILLTGTLLIRFSMLIIAAGLLVATLASPASASAATVTTGQVPASDDQIASHQAHSIWLAAKQEAGMQATVEYLVSVNGSTATLVSILEDNRYTADRIPALSTPEGLDQVQRDLRTITRLSTEETCLQMEAAGGNQSDLTEAVHAAGEASPNVKALRDRYWQVKMTAQLDDFDLRVGIVQKTISTLKEDGYEVATAQETFDKIAAMRSELASALSSEDYSSIESANRKIHAAFVNLSRIITDLHVAITIPVPGFVGSQVEVPR
jgi:hypothetical protein